MELAEPTIVYNDGLLLAVDKPSGLLVAPDRWDKAAAHLVQWVHAHAGAEWFNVHRLDRETSGVVLFGRGETVAVLTSQFETRQVSKVYESLVHGRPARGRGAIAAPLSPDPRRPGRMIVDPAGSPARTQYETRRVWRGAGERIADERVAGILPAPDQAIGQTSTLQQNDAGGTPATRSTGISPMQPATGETSAAWQDRHGQDARATVSLLELWPLTGRTHQLRVHLASIGCPILADPFYGAGEADHDIIPRLALHARRLTLTHPATGQPLTIEAPRPLAFEDAMAKLG